MGGTTFLSFFGGRGEGITYYGGASVAEHAARRVRVSLSLTHTHTLSLYIFGE